MRASVLLGMAMLNYDINYSAPARGLIYLGYEPTSKKRIAHRQRKAAERRKASQVIRKAHKNRNKKGRP